MLPSFGRAIPISVQYATAIPTSSPTILVHSLPFELQSIGQSDDRFVVDIRRFARMRISISWTAVPNAAYYILRQRKAPPKDFSALDTIDGVFNRSNTSVGNRSNLVQSSVLGIGTMSARAGMAAETSVAAGAAETGRRRATLSPPFVLQTVDGHVVVRFSSAGDTVGFFTVWYKATTTGEVRCLTNGQLSGNWSSAAGQDCFRVASQESQALLTTPAFSPWALVGLNTTDVQARTAECPVLPRHALQQLFVLACVESEGPSEDKQEPGSTDGINGTMGNGTSAGTRTAVDMHCDTEAPSDQVLLEIGCTFSNLASVKLLPQTGYSVDLGAACVAGSAIERSAQVCDVRHGHNYISHNNTGHDYIGHDYIGHNYIGPQVCDDRYGEWTEAACVKDESGLCAQFPSASAELAELSPCEHADRFVIEPMACFDDACSAPEAAPEIVDFEFQHYLGRRAIECMPDLDKAAQTAGQAAVATVAGAVAASVAINLAGTVSTAASASTGAGSTAATAGAGQGVGGLQILGAVQFVAVSKHASRSSACDA